MAEDGAEKTEEPTWHKLQQAREKGQVAKSMEITSALILLAAGGALFLLGPLGMDRLAGLLRHFISSFSDNKFFSQADAMALLVLILKEFLIIVVPFALIIMAVGVAIGAYQVDGLMVSSEALVPKLDKLNFIKGFGRFFSIKSIVECLKSIFKLSLIMYMCYLVIRDNMPGFIGLPDTEVLQAALFTLKVALEIFLKTCLFLTVLAVADYAYQRWQFMKDMRMSKQEIKDEFKQMEGDPIIKSRIRQAQREASKKRMLADVPKADVVITNPTHFAIALMYDAREAQAPLVLAKGQDLMAQRIKDIAREAKVPIVENKPLAQALYKTVDIGQMIPTEFYKAVADVLSYVYRVKGRKKRG